MLTTFVIPIEDTSGTNCDFESNLSTEEYTSIIIDNFNRNYQSINNFVNGNKNNCNVDISSDKTNIDVENRYIFSKTEAQIVDVDHNEITIQDIFSIQKSCKKTLLRVNINPNTMDDDAIVEMNYWISDSRKILNDTSLDKYSLLNTLPQMDFLIDDSNVVFRLCDCKIMEVSSEENNPYSFTILVNKINKY